ncbi:hypothetical protein K466DRAFT_224957, partial [Polyporus arcularius HHB13444]
VLRGTSRFVRASARAPSQYFPVLLRPSGWAGHSLLSFRRPNPNPMAIAGVSTLLIQCNYSSQSADRCLCSATLTRIQRAD